jgi:hypothetical protein
LEWGANLLFPEFSESGMEQKPTAAPAKKKKKIPSKQKRTEKTEESWEGGGKKNPEKTI